MLQALLCALLALSVPEIPDLGSKPQDWQGSVVDQTLTMGCCSYDNVQLTFDCDLSGNDCVLLVWYDDGINFGARRYHVDCETTEPMAYWHIVYEPGPVLYLCVDNFDYDLEVQPMVFGDGTPPSLVDLGSRRANLPTFMDPLR